MITIRTHGCLFLKCLICSMTVSKSVSVWATTNSARRDLILQETKSSAFDTDARTRKFADRKMVARPSRSKLLLPRIIVSRDFWRLFTATLLLLDMLVLGRRTKPSDSV